MTDPLKPHAHEPNPDPPPGPVTIEVLTPGQEPRALTLAALAHLPQMAVANCFIVSTGHGTSGPFTFSGPRLQAVLEAYSRGSWEQVEVVSADGFGTRLTGTELAGVDRPILLATHIDGLPLTRAAGLVRLIVPSELDDALRQVKWVRTLRMR